MTYVTMDIETFDKKYTYTNFSHINTMTVAIELKNVPKLK